MALTKPGLLGGTAATGYPSIWGEASGGPGILGYTPPGFTPGVGVGAPMPVYKSPAPVGGTPYGNYVRQWPDLMTAFKDESNTIPNISDWGRAHWEGHGQWEPGRLAGGRPEDRPVNPNVTRGDVMDTGPSALAQGSSGLPMPDVEGYSYVYPRYSWDNQTGYTQGGTKSYETDINKYPYFPSMPQTGGSIFRDKEGKDLQTILMGVQLVPNSWVGK